MKLNVKRTVLIGLGFLTIMMLWQVYNWMVPLFLDEFMNDLFAGNELVIGIIMALDNLFALFTIPIMSNLSDRTNTKIGRRMPYITIGIILSAVTFACMPFTKSSGSIWLLLANILLVLISMNIYRSPCVALMPDITPKPLRSKANSIINIMGGVGTAIGYVGILFLSGTEWLPFILVSVVMLLCLAVMLWKVKERVFVSDYKTQLESLGLDENEDKKEDEVKGTKLNTFRRNVWLTLLVVFLVYMANNSVETFMSLYSKNVYGEVAGLPFGMSAGALAILPFGIGVFASAYPAALVANKIGRRNTILLGAVVMLASYVGIALFNSFSYVVLGVFFVLGLGFSFVTINIYPMVVENCSAADTGRYTGYYYTASMLAQSITPAFCGLFIGLVFSSYRVLFPYAVVCMLAVIVVLLFIKSDKNTLGKTKTQDENLEKECEEVLNV